MSGPSQQPQSQQNSQSVISQYAAPYVQQMLGQASALTSQPYNQYNGPSQVGAPGASSQTYANGQVAGTTALQNQAYNTVANMQVAPQIGQGTNIANNAAANATNIGNNAVQTGALGLGYGSTAAQAGNTGQAYGAQGASLGAQGADLAPAAQSYGALGANIGNTATGLAGTAGAYGASGMGMGTQGAGMGVLGAGYGAQGAGIGQNVAAQSQNSSTGPGSVGSYMNPYLAQSLAPQMQLLNQQYGIQGQNEQSAATAAGGFGGSREALASSLNTQNQDLAMNQLVSQGYNTAFNNAQNQMNTAAGLGMQGSQVGISGAQTGIAGANTGIAGAQTGLAGVGQANAAYNTGIAGANTGLAGIAGANQSYQTGLAGTAQGIQGANTNIAGQQAAMQGVNTALQGESLGLQGANTALSGANTLGALGQNQYTQNAGITQAQLTAGTQQQGLNQNIANTLYGSYQNQLNQPYNQLGFMSNMMAGVPLGGQSTQVYQQPATLASQVASLGLGAYGISNAFAAKGGKVKRASVGKKNMGEGLAKLGLQKAMARG